jgi:hypothetical protein
MKSMHRPDEAGPNPPSEIAGTPASVVVGTSGFEVSRASAVTANALIVP